MGAIRVQKAGVYVVLTAAFVGLLALAMSCFVVVANSDLYGRLIDTQTAPGVGIGNRSEDVPQVILVLHRLVDGENAVEASILIETYNQSSSLVADGKMEYVAEVRDGTGSQPFGISNRAVLNAASAQARAGQNALAVESQRFPLPILPSVSGFPFDDILVMPIVSLYENGAATDAYRVDIERALPGRLMHLSRRNPVEISLTRSPTEKGLVVSTSVVFLFLSAVLAYSLFSNPGLQTIDELLGVGGYLVAAAGFREVLGISRAAGTSALEIGVIGLPVLVLSLGVAVSIVRGRRQKPAASNAIP